MFEAYTKPHSYLTKKKKKSKESMASIPCIFQIPFTAKPINPSFPSLPTFSSKFLGTQNSLSCLRPSNIGPSNGSRTQCWFKFGKNGVDAEGAGIYGSQKRDDFDKDDVEQYFNYMGMLAVEGSYDKMEALLNQNIHPVDILLMLAASEGDQPKIEELLRAGAVYDVKDADGRTAVDRAVNEEIKDFILGFSVQKA
ncbi:protein LHCP TRANSLOCATION DEFECT [Gossypium hirsutum]|uniref:Protein LHCP TRANSLOCATION DEFECT n=2 Tax=Gossypium TaxID=3633 RepID=A0A1U8LVZ8_GOSHI|nr:protein LHCP TRANSLOCATION DEFECT [Gossypium hirsutum]